MSALSGDPGSPQFGFLVRGVLIALGEVTLAEVFHTPEKEEVERRDAP